MARVNVIPASADFILWYAQNIDRVKYRQLYLEKSLAGEGGDHYRLVALHDGSIRPIRSEEVLDPTLLPDKAAPLQYDTLISQGFSEALSGAFEFEGRSFSPGGSAHWKTTPAGRYRLAAAGRTMSPVAAVTLMCASLTESEPLALAKRVAGPLLVGLAVVVLTAFWMGVPR